LLMLLVCCFQFRHIYLNLLHVWKTSTDEKQKEIRHQKRPDDLPETEFGATIITFPATPDRVEGRLAGATITEIFQNTFFILSKNPGPVPSSAKTSFPLPSITIMVG